MKSNNLGFTQCGIKNISRLLLLSFTFSVLFDALPLRAQVVNKALTPAAQTQRTTMVNNLSKSLTSYLSNTENSGAGFPAWKALSAAAATGNIQPLNQTVGSSTFNLVGQTPNFRHYSYAGLYNYFGVKAYDSSYNILGGIMYFGDGSGSGSVSAYGEPGNTSILPAAQPMASFFQPSTLKYNFPVSNNFEKSGGILKKTGSFCDALDVAFGNKNAGSGWLGATCVTTDDCCQNAVGQAAGVGASGGNPPVSGSVECRMPVAQAPYAVDPQDPSGKTTINYGICDVKPAPPAPSNNCGAAPQAVCGTIPTANCCINGLAAVFSGSVIQTCSCLIPLNNTGVATGILCKSSKDCAPTGSVNNVCNTKTGICVAPPSNALFGGACAVPPTTTPIDPTGIATTCVTGQHLGCDYQPVTIEGVTYPATNQCKGKSGYECGMISDCLAGYECNANGSGTQVCESTCTVGSAAVTTVTSGSSCKSNTGPCCTTSGFTCDASQAVANKDVCCINPNVGDGGNAYAFTASDCCNGFVLGNALIAGTSLGTANFCSITREKGCTKDSDCPAVEYAPNGGTQTCLIAKPYYYCQVKDPVSAVGDALSAVGLDSLIAGSAFGGLTFLYLLYKAGKTIAVKVKNGIAEAKDATRGARVLSDPDAAGRLTDTVSALGGSSDDAASVVAGVRAVMNGQDTLMASGTGDRAISSKQVGGPGEDSVPPAVVAAAAVAGGGGGGGGGQPLFSAATTEDLNAEIVKLRVVSETVGGYHFRPANIGNGEDSDLLVHDVNHDLVKAYTMRRLLNPEEDVGLSLAEIGEQSGLFSPKDIAALRENATDVRVVAFGKAIMLKGIGKIIKKPAGMADFNFTLDRLPTNLKAYVQAFMTANGATFEDAYYTLAKTLTDPAGNPIIPTDIIPQEGFTDLPDLF